MKITFLIPHAGISGGVKAVFELANYLHEYGHNISVVHSLVPFCSGPNGYDMQTIKKRIKGTLRNWTLPNRVDWFNLKAKLVRVPVAAERYIPDGDVIVATWWETAYYVSKYGGAKGKKFYFAQHYETWGGPKEKVDNSYRLGLKIVVNSNWLKNILEDKVGTKVEAMILHAPDWNDFYPDDDMIRGNGSIKVLMPSRPEEWKGTQDGIKAFEIARKELPDLRLVMFGPDRNNNIPSHAEFHLRPSNAELRRLYCSCDIFGFPSWHEGFGMPPMEAMACRCPVVTTDVGAVSDYTIPGKTALVCRPRDAAGMAHKIITLAKEESKRKDIAVNGYNFIRQFTWAEAARKFEKVLKSQIA